MQTRLTSQSSLIHRLLRRDDALPLVLLRMALSPLQLLYMFVVTARNALYDAGLLHTAKVDVPVISVGNLSVGGTGKTPLVIALAAKGVAAGKQVAIVTRGYGAVADDLGRSDEVVLITERVPQAQVLVSPDKLLGAREAASAGAEVIILDDGFQHRRLERDLDIVLVDAREPFGNGQQLPCGPLREAPSALERADLVVMTHSEGVDPSRLNDQRARIDAQQRGVPIVLAEHRAVGVRSVCSRELHPVSDLAGVEVFLFCGIGSPESFATTVEGLGAEVTGMLAFPDHHRFDGGDLARVRAMARTALLLCTEKDAGKVAAISGNDDVVCLVIEMDLVGAWPSLPGIDS